MTREEREKAIDALKISTPIMAMTHEEFNDYIQTLNKIMDWLEEESTTKNDLGVDSISRQVISDYVESHIQEINTGYGDLNRHTNSILRMIVDYIENMPSVTPQEPKWIPVSERLPDTDDEVLCWYEYYHWSREKVLPEYGLGRYLTETSSWFGEVANGHKVRVIAWMPLHPYKVESEDKK